MLSADDSLRNVLPHYQPGIELAEIACRNLRWMCDTISGVLGSDFRASQRRDLIVAKFAPSRLRSLRRPRHLEHGALQPPFLDVRQDGFDSA